MSGQLPMRVIVLSGSGLSADSGLPTFRGAGGLYQDLSAEEFLSATTYARDPDAVESWIDQLRSAAAQAVPNAAHRGFAAYQARHPDTRLLTQNVDMLLERAGARDVVHLHGRLDQMRCLGRAHAIPLGGDPPPSSSGRCPQCHSRLRSDVVLFGERAPAYEELWRALRRATARDALVVVGTQGNVLPIDEMVRAFRGRSVLNNLHESEWIASTAFSEVVPGPAADAISQVIGILDGWRGE